MWLFCLLREISSKKKNPDSPKNESGLVAYNSLKVHRDVDMYFWPVPDFLNFDVNVTL